MKLTALEIKQQTFERSIRGYDVTEVQAFLNLTANEWEHMAGRIKELESQIDQLHEKLHHYEKVEEALHETLQAARDSADIKLADARKDVQLMVEKAEHQAEAIIRDANAQRQAIRQSVLRLLDKREEMVAGIRSYLKITGETLEQFAKDEAHLFKMPKGGEDATEISFEPTPSSSSQDKVTDEEREMLPGGVRSMDDILDQIRPGRDD